MATVDRNPWCVPRSGLLLARTCINCGQLLPAERFGVSNAASGKRRQSCRACMTQAPSWRRVVQQRKSAQKWYWQCQQLTMHEATRYGAPWTTKEVQLLANPRLSNLQAALDLGRSYASVAMQRRRLGITYQRPRKEWQLYLADNERKAG